MNNATVYIYKHERSDTFDITIYDNNMDMIAPLYCIEKYSISVCAEECDDDETWVIYTHHTHASSLLDDFFILCKEIDIDIGQSWKRVKKEVE